MRNLFTNNIHDLLLHFVSGVILVYSKHKMVTVVYVCACVSVCCHIYTMLEDAFHHFQ